MTMTVNKRWAVATGYRALTSRYCLPEERQMLENVLADMRRGFITHVLVKDRLGVSVWRRGAGRSAGSSKSEIRRPKVREGRGGGELGLGGCGRGGGVIAVARVNRVSAFGGVALGRAVSSRMRR